MRTITPVADRVYSRLVEDENGCWVWTGARSAAGYGVVGLTSRHLVYVHRWVWEDMVAPIPDGLVMDHHCLNPACANPAHVEPVTRAVNNARGGRKRGSRKAA